MKCNEPMLQSEEPGHLKQFVVDPSGQHPLGMSNWEELYCYCRSSRNTLDFPSGLGTPWQTGVGLLIQIYFIRHFIDRACLNVLKLYKQYFKPGLPHSRFAEMGWVSCISCYTFHLQNSYSQFSLDSGSGFYPVFSFVPCLLFLLKSGQQHICVTFGTFSHFSSLLLTHCSSLWKSWCYHSFCLLPVWRSGYL